MTQHHPGTPARAAGFDALLAEVMATASRFGHRQHIHLTWLAVRQHGVLAAVTLVSDGIQRTARYAGAPQKYHVTVSRAWVELVGHHAADRPEPDFPAFAAHHPLLLDKRLLTRFYRPATLASPHARTQWVAPDLAPFPWMVTPPRAGPIAAARWPAPPAPGAPRSAPPRAARPAGPGTAIPPPPAEP
jgi:hypothetical protein